MQFSGTRVQFSQSNLGSILNLGIIFPPPSIPDIIGPDGCDDMTHSQMLGKFEYTRGPIFKVVLEC